MDIILASASPRRKEILSSLGLNFKVIVSSVSEESIPKDLPPHIYVQELSMLKSTDVAKNIKKESLCIGADTIVYHNQKIIGKPKNFDEAFNMLSSFSGSFHEVISSVSVTNSKSMKTVTDYCITKVYFSHLSDDEIASYINRFSPYDKAGGYGIQEYAGAFIEKIEGDYFNVVGLPVNKLYKLLKKEFDFII